MTNDEPPARHLVQQQSNWHCVLHSAFIIHHSSFNKGTATLWVDTADQSSDFPPSPASDQRENPRADANPPPQGGIGAVFSRRHGNQESTASFSNPDRPCRSGRSKNHVSGRATVFTTDRCPTENSLKPENRTMPDGKRKRRHSPLRAKREWYAKHRAERFRRRFGWAT